MKRASNFIAFLSLCICLGLIVIWFSWLFQLIDSYQFIIIRHRQFTASFGSHERITVSQYPRELFTFTPWLWILLTSIVPVIRARVKWIRSRIRAHRAADGLCVTCGYDLRATPDRCP